MREETLRVGIALSGRQACFWRGLLARALRADGHDVGFLPGPVDPEPPGLGLLARLETLIYRGPLVPAPNLPDCGERDFDLIVTGGGGEPPPSGPPVLSLACDGAPCALGADSAILDLRSPALQAWLLRPGQGDGVLIASGRAALEEPYLYFRSRERVAARLAGLARAAVRRLSAEGFGAEPVAAEGAFETDGPRHPLRFAAGALAARVARRLTWLAGRGARWRVAWRVTSGDEVARRATWSAFAFHNLPDDGRRYYADPFVWMHGDRTFVLCEEFPYATGRGLVSVFEIRDGRVVAAPRPVLEQPYHLSYPMVFARDGAIWMIPETSAADRIELWRAESFPDRWTRAAILVDGVAASDATLLERDGRLWLFATVAEAGGSSWDCLCLWSAERLEGPWAAHPANPVVTDASCARPAGMPFARGGRWIRPAQDCSRLYGGGLALCAIDRLDATGFSQSLVTRLSPPPGSQGRGVHTLNAAGNVEAVDIFGPRPRTGAPARPFGGDASRPRPSAEVSQKGSSP